VRAWGSRQATARGLPALAARASFDRSTLKQKKPPVAAAARRSPRHPPAKRKNQTKQVYDWSFDVFDVARRTGGRPLYAVTMALFEEEGLFVSPSLFVRPRSSSLCARRPTCWTHRPPPKKKKTRPRTTKTKQDDWLLDRPTVSAYLDACETTYRAANPYHNNTHAADVTQTAAVLLRAFCSAAERPVPKMERFCVLLASAVHDLGHPGVNNDFLVRTRHRLAGLYNDRSVNEHYHCATAFHLAHSVVATTGAAAGAGAGGGAERGNGNGGGGGNGGTGAPPTLQRAAADDGLGGPAALLPPHASGGSGRNAPPQAAAAAATAATEAGPVVGDGGIFSRFSLEDYARARALVVAMVLSTDMGVHFDLLANFRAAVEREGGRPPGAWADRSLAYQLLVHLADLANPSRPFPLALKWAENVVAEFLAQGDAEAASGVAVSAMCDRERVSMPRAQLNFVSVFMRPTLDALSPAVPDFASAARPCLDDTVAKWEWLEGAGVRLPREDHVYPSLPAEMEASRPWEQKKEAEREKEQMAGGVDAVAAVASRNGGGKEAPPVANGGGA
jgi:hypothetical protein